MRLRAPAGTCALLGISYSCCAQSRQVSQSTSTAQPVKLLVDGNVMAVKLVHTVAPASPQIALTPHALLRQGALHAPRQWCFEPTLLNGQPGEVETTISVSFSFHDAVPFSFKTDVREGGSSHAILTETICVSGVGKTADWTNFMGGYEDATSGIWLEGIPSSAAAKQGGVTASVTLRRDGGPDRGVRLTHSWGDAAIDCATGVAIQKSAPPHGLPSDLSEPTIAVRVPYAYDDPHAAAPPSGAAQ